MNSKKLRMLSQNKNNLITKKKSNKKKVNVQKTDETLCDMPSIDESILLLKNLLATKRKVKREIKTKIPPKKEPHTYLKASTKSINIKKNNKKLEKKRVILINGHVLNRKKN